MRCARRDVAALVNLTTFFSQLGTRPPQEYTGPSQVNLTRQSFDSHRSLTGATRCVRIAHAIGRIDGMMLVVDQQEFLTWLRVREANTARIFAIDSSAHAALSRKLAVR